PSYVDTISEGETEYAIDSAGNIRHDDQGRPIVFRRPQRGSGGRGGRHHVTGDDDDDYDEDAIRHERELAARYGSSYGEAGGSGHGMGGEVLPEAPTVPSTSAQAMADYHPTSGEEAQSPYEGQTYGSGGGNSGGWKHLRSASTAHHHPTRLSDVLEEDEERSSRRTGE
ncbi:hypothetical protein KC343_g13046, partial [Hortaea werneckii]